MDDIRGKMAYLEELRNLGLNQDQIQDKLAEYDAMEDEQKSLSLAALTQLRVEGAVPVPSQDLQSNEQNAQAARKIQAGSYDPTFDNKHVQGLRTPEQQRQDELRASMDMPSEVDEQMTKIDQTIEARAQPRRVRAEKPLIVIGGSSKLAAPKVKP